MSGCRVVGLGPGAHLGRDRELVRDTAGLRVLLLLDGPLDGVEAVRGRGRVRVRVGVRVRVRVSGQGKGQGQG